jgi:citrate lyase subunit beta/citryl-CoA lyase
MPAANARAMAKARDLACDGVIFDLEDAVAPDAKALARTQMAAAVEEGGYAHREIVVRINGLDTPWGADDLAAVAALPLDAVLLPKVETTWQIGELEARLPEATPIWIMVETPRGILDLQSVVASSERVEVLVMGTSDLVKELGARHTPDRRPALHALSHSIMVARAFDRMILDGVHLEFRDEASFRDACVQGRQLGFDGKSLIHPSQVDIANEIFGPSSEEVDDAQRVLHAWDEAQKAGKGVAVLDGRLVENLHVAEAERVLALAAALERG